jgi:5-methylcytosine-specific restriction protein A
MARPAGRNPTWAYDELILALDLYLEIGPPDQRNPRVVELSNVLNALPIHTVRPDIERFRNPSSVALKLSNFAALDPEYPGVGMTRGGRRDAEVWDRYRQDGIALKALAGRIRAGATEVATFPVVPEEGEDEVEEGRLVYREHRVRERDPNLIRRKKAAARTLDCEICGFNFGAAYGELGEGFIEAHHAVPLSKTGPNQNPAIGPGPRMLKLPPNGSQTPTMAHRR